MYIKDAQSVYVFLLWTIDQRTRSYNFSYNFHIYSSDSNTYQSAVLTLTTSPIGPNAYSYSSSDSFVLGRYDLISVSNVCQPHRVSGHGTWQWEAIGWNYEHEADRAYATWQHKTMFTSICSDWRPAWIVRNVLPFLTVTCTEWHVIAGKVSTTVNEWNWSLLLLRYLLDENAL